VQTISITYTDFCYLGAEKHTYINIKMKKTDEENLAGATAENAPSNKLFSRMQKMGKTWEKDEDAMDMADEYISELEAFKEKSIAEQQEIMDIIDQNPVLARILTDLGAGASLNVALARHVDPEDLQAQEGDPDYEAWAENSRQRKEEATQRNKWMEEVAANEEMSKAEMQAFADESGMEPDEVAEFFEFLNNTLTEIYNGKINRTTLKMLHKAFKHDETVKDAMESGKVMGRNEKIVASRAKTDEIDGLPKITPAGDGTKPAPKKGYIETLKERTN